MGQTSGESATLAGNLAALRATQPELAARLDEPRDDSHVDPGPPARYRLHRSWLPLEESGPPAPGELEAAGEVLLAGVGAGELLARLLAGASAARVTAWDRDPSMLRLVLDARDWTTPLREGRLRFALGTDLLGLPLGGGAALVEHPLLGELYRRDLAFARAVSRAPGAKRAAMCTGGLLIESLSDSLERLDYRVWPLELRRTSVEEIERTLARVAPELVVAVNYTNGLAELCERHGARLLAWEIDPTTSRPRLDGPGSTARVFTWRRRGVEEFRRAGFAHARHLPLAADHELRRPVEFTAEERERYRAPISYVGQSMVGNVETFQRRFLALWQACGGAPAEGQKFMQDALAEQRGDFSRFLLPQLLADRAPRLVEAHAAGTVAEDPAVLLGEISASEKRLTYVATLAGLGVQVWGDAGWKLVERHGARYRGPAGHGDELTRIYGASDVNLDVGRIFQADIATIRTFDVLACGGFALVEHNPDLEQLFELGRELETYRTLAELKEKAAYYATHPDERRAIATRGREAVLARHTVDRRLGTMLEA